MLEFIPSKLKCISSFVRMSHFDFIGYRFQAEDSIRALFES